MNISLSPKLCEGIQRVNKSADRSSSNELLEQLKSITKRLERYIEESEDYISRKVSQEPFVVDHNRFSHIKCVSSLDDIPANAELYIYGVGSAGRGLEEDIALNRPDIKIISFVDSNPSGKSTQRGVIKVDELGRHYKEGQGIIIASYYWKEIADELNRLGFKANIFVKIFGVGDWPWSAKLVAISHKKKFIYVVNPKVASTHFRRAIFEFEGVDLKSDKYINLDDDKYVDYFKFSFVRDPRDRIVSYYEDHINCQHLPFEERPKDYYFPLKWFLGVDQMTFGDFVGFIHGSNDLIADVHWRSQNLTIGYDKLDFVGKYESIKEDTEKVSDMLGAPLRLLPRYKHSVDRNHNDYYDEATKKLIEERFRFDMEVFGYK